MAQERFLPEIARFMREGPAKTAPCTTVVCLGSSIMRLWPLHMAETLLGRPVLNLAFGGSQTHDLVEHMDVLCDLVARSQPSYILFYCGSNDISYGSMAPDVFARAELFLTKILRTCREGTRCYVISVLASPEKREDNMLYAQVVDYNAKLAHLCQKNTSMTFVDVNARMTSTKGNLQKYFEFDGVHLTEQGYEEWGRVIHGAVLA